ncbi:papain-like cysteine protease family protein [Allosphingosinicella deserti]|nr:papain-like cysteine protease family protein [Sphingomonas deserti]
MAQSLLMASFESGAGPAFVARHGQTAADYQATFDEWTGKQYQPVCVSVYRDGTTARYASIFHQKNGVAFVARHGLDGSQYQSQVTAWTKEGYRPRSLSAATVDGKTVFACVYEKNGSAEWAARHGLSAADYQSVFNDMVGKGFRPRAVCPYTVDGKDHYIAWWEKSPGNAWVARHGLSESAFRQTHESLAAQGYDLVSGGSCLVGSSDRYAGIWEKRSASSIGHHGMTSGAYQANFEAALAQKLRPSFVSGSWGAVPVDVNLRFRIQRQQQSQWCWAACSVSVRRYYQPASTLTQCQLVNTRRGRSDCCTSGSSMACNLPDNTADALDGLGHLGTLTGSSVDYSVLRDQSAAGRPTFLRIQWSGGGRHAILATGVEDGEFVIVCDPGSSSAVDPSLGTTSVVDYDTLRTAYNGSGTWIATGTTNS